MLPTHEHVADVQGHAIYRRRPGFEYTPVTLGKIASFLVRRPDGGVAVFAFLYSLLMGLGGPRPDEARLLDEALHTIEDVLAGGAATTGHDQTYERHGDRWVPVDAPRWWIPTTP